MSGFRPLPELATVQEYLTARMLRLVLRLFFPEVPSLRPGSRAPHRNAHSLSRGRVPYSTSSNGTTKSIDASTRGLTRRGPFEAVRLLSAHRTAKHPTLPGPWNSSAFDRLRSLRRTCAAPCCDFDAAPTVMMCEARRVSRSVGDGSSSPIFRLAIPAPRLPIPSATLRSEHSP